MKGEREYLNNLLNEAHTVKQFLEADKVELGKLREELKAVDGGVEISPSKADSLRKRIEELFALVIEHQGWLGDHEADLVKARKIFCAT